MRILHTVPVPDRRVLPLTKAAKYLGVSRATLVKYGELGMIAPFDLAGRRVYKLEDLDAIVESLKTWQPNSVR